MINGQQMPIEHNILFSECTEILVVIPMTNERFSYQLSIITHINDYRFQLGFRLHAPYSEYENNPNMYKRSPVSKTKSYSTGNVIFI